MRNLRKLTAVVVAIALVLTSMATVFAASTTYEFEAQATVLKDLGIWTGNASGDLMLGKGLTRAEGAVLVLKTVLGKTEADMEAADVTSIDIFADAAKVPSWAEGWVALAVETGVVNGSDNKLNAAAPLLAKDLASMFMNALGFKAENDYAKAVELLAAKATITSISAKIPAGDALLRDAASAIVTDALTAKAKDATETVIAKYVGSDASLKAIAEKAGLIVVVTVPTVVSVKALNLKQLAVEYAGTIVKADAEKISNYAVTEGTTEKAVNGSAALKDDGKTVLLTLGTSINNGATAKVEVKNIATYSNDVKFEDTVVPSIIGLTVAGPNTVTVEYSEPVKFKTTSAAAIAAGEFKVDGGNYVVSKVDIDINKLTLTVGVNFTNGDHKLSFESKGEVLDFADYKVLPRTIDFTVASDTTAPVFTVKSVDPKQVVLKANKPLNVSSINGNGNVVFRHTYNTTTYQVVGATTGAVLNAAGTELTLDFDGKVIPLGASKIYIDYTSSTGEKITDLWGNKMEATSVDINVTLDTVKPTVSDVTFENASQLKVTFSEKVELGSAQTTSNYIVKDSAGKTVSLLTPVRGSGDDENKVTLTTATTDALGGGTYTIEIKGVKDQSFVNNVMDIFSKTLNLNDKVAPYVNITSSSIVIDSVSKASIYIPFSEAMDVASLVKGNFMKSLSGGSNYSALGDDDTVTIAPDAKSVKIVLDKSSTNLQTAGFAQIRIKVGIVKDVAGNGLKNYTQDVAFTGLDSIKVEKVEATATKEVKVTFNGRLSTASAMGFAITSSPTSSTENAIRLSVVTNSINSDGKSEIVFNLGSALGEDTRINNLSTYLVVDGASETKSYLGAVLSNTTTGGLGFPITDKIAPTVKDVKALSTTQIVVTFNEDINDATMAATLNGFTVSGGDAELTTVIRSDTTPNAIVLAGKNFAGDVTVIKYNSAAGVTDMSGNKIADFEKTAAKP